MTAQAKAQEIVTALTDGASGKELAQLTRIVTGEIVQLMRSDPAAAQALCTEIGNNEQAVDNIIRGIGNTTMTNLSAAMAAEPNIHAGINRGIAANLRSGGLIIAAIDAAIATAGPGAPVVVVAGQLEGPVQCGTPAQLGDGQTRVVRAGYCFPDKHNGCNGSILVDPKDPTKEIKTEDIFKRDSLFVNFNDGGNTLSRILAEITDIAHASFVVEDPNANIFNYRSFFMVDPSDKNIRDNRENTETNLVRLRYAVGNSYTRFATDLKGVMANGTAITPGTEYTEILEARKTIGRLKFDSNWMICPRFFTYRMLPLKPDFMSAMEYNRSRHISRNNKRQKCIGITPPSTEKVVNDVYVYTFVNRRTGDYITKNIPINKKVRKEDNSFGPGDLPYEDEFFIFPEGFKETVVCARFPDGILLFSYNGIVSPIPPFGTVVNKSKLHNTARETYPDQATHNLVTTELDTAMAHVETNIGTLNAKQVRMYGQNLPLNSPGVAVLKNIIIGGIGYITMMRVIKGIVSQTGIVFSGGRHRFMTRGRRHNKSVKRNRMKSKSKGMTKSKGRGRGRARAASMLKSAKQRFYKAGGGGSMGLGFGPSVPQPLQNESPLVSQASPV
jgi:hypothetical protein